MRFRGRTPVVAWFAAVAVLLASTTTSAQTSATEPPPERRALTLYKQGDLSGALELWNEVGQPRTATISLVGVERTRPTVGRRLVDIPPKSLLTREVFDRTNRRLAELPAMSSAGLTYQAPTSGTTRVTATFDERNVLPKGLFGWAAVGVRALFLDDLRVDVSNALGLGEVVGGSYRWKSRRPRVLADVAVPVPGALPGLLTVEGMWEEQTYAFGPLNDGLPFIETRRRAVGTLSDWGTSWLRWAVGGGVDRIDTRTFATVAGSLGSRWFNDQLAVVGTIGRWSSSATSFHTGEVVGTWRSTARSDLPVVTVLGGVAAASERAPFAVWPGASSGKGRGALLRAHSLLQEDVVTEGAFGRRLVFGTVEYERPIWQNRYARVAAAAFTDVVRASRRVTPTPSPVYIDVGGGIRFNAPGAGGKVRLDLAFGPRDGAMKVSAGYLSAWGTR